MKKLLVTLLVLAVAFAAFAGGQEEPASPKTEEAPKAEAPAAKAIKNPDTMIRVAYGTVDSLDPAKAYDNVSGGCIQNVYENLIFYKGSSTEEFVPVLSTQVPSAANGLITNGGKTYRFPIRKGVKFHSGNALTPEGVAYSFKRNLVTDVDGGPMWMLFEPLFGTYGSRDDDGKVVLTLAELDQAIQVQGDSVVFNLKAPFAPFLAILAYNCNVIVDKDFVIAKGGWNGTQADIARANNPEAGKETLYEVASGTAPLQAGPLRQGGGGGLRALRRLLGPQAGHGQGHLPHRGGVVHPQADAAAGGRGLRAGGPAVLRGDEQGAGA